MIQVWEKICPIYPVYMYCVYIYIYVYAYCVYVYMYCVYTLCTVFIYICVCVLCIYVYECILCICVLCICICAYVCENSIRKKTTTLLSLGLLANITFLTKISVFNKKINCDWNCRSLSFVACKALWVIVNLIVNERAITWNFKSKASLQKMTLIYHVL